MFSAPISLALYATVFERYGALDRLEAFASFNGPDFYGEQAWGGAAWGSSDVE